MKKKLTVNLLRTFLYSLLLTGFFFVLYYGADQRGFEEGQAMKILFFFTDVFQNIFLLVASATVYFLLIPAIYASHVARVTCYFGGPVLLTLMFVLFVGNSSFDKLGFLLPAISFLIIHGYFFRSVRQHGNRAEIDKTNNQAPRNTV